MIEEISTDKIFTSVIHKVSKWASDHDQCTDIHAGCKNGGEKKKKKPICYNKFC